jgi:hypothetical protein
MQHIMHCKPERRLFVAADDDMRLRCGGEQPPPALSLSKKNQKTWQVEVGQSKAGFRFFFYQSTIGHLGTPKFVTPLNFRKDQN